MRSGDCRPIAAAFICIATRPGRTHRRDKKSPAAKQGLSIYADRVRWVCCPVAVRTSSRFFSSAQERS